MQQLSFQAALTIRALQAAFNRDGFVYYAVAANDAIRPCVERISALAAEVGAQCHYNKVNRVARLTGIDEGTYLGHLQLVALTTPYQRICGSLIDYLAIEGYDRDLDQQQMETKYWLQHRLERSPIGELITPQVRVAFGSASKVRHGVLRVQQFGSLAQTDDLSA